MVTRLVMVLCCRIDLDGILTLNAYHDAQPRPIGDVPQHQIRNVRLPCSDRDPLVAAHHVSLYDDIGSFHGNFGSAR